MSDFNDENAILLAMALALLERKFDEFSLLCLVMRDLYLDMGREGWARWWSERDIRKCSSIDVGDSGTVRPIKASWAFDQYVAFWVSGLPDTPHLVNFSMKRPILWDQS